MLIISGRTDETIAIGDSVRITVLGSSATSIRLGIDSPLAVSVDRIERRFQSDEFDDGPAYAALGATVDASDYEFDAELV